MHDGSWRKQTIKWLTVVIVVMLLMNPETIQLGLFVDAVGVDAFVVLLEVQVLTVLAISYQRWLKPVVDACWCIASRLRAHHQSIGWRRAVQLEIASLTTDNARLGGALLMAGGVAFLVAAITAYHSALYLPAAAFLALGGWQVAIPAMAAARETELT